MTIQIPLSKIDRAGREDRGDLEYRARSCLPSPFDRECGVLWYARPRDSSWVLIDTGLPTSRGAIVAVAEARFGKNA